MAKDGTIKINTELDSSKAQNAMSKFSSMAQSALKGVAIAAGTVNTAMTAIATYSIKVGSDFEAGMSKVSAISGATGDDLDALTEKAKEMGAKTKFSATEAASAFEYMAMAGWKTEDMLNGIEGVMNLAAASGEDLAATSDIVTDALTAFGLSASDSAHFADVLAQASSNSNTNVGLMGDTFKYVAPVAGALGFSVEDCAIAIGLMANSGIKASQAGTSLRQIFTNLVKPTDAMQGAMDKLGISLTDSAGNTKTLDTLTGELRQSFSGLTEAEKAQYAATLAGQEGMSGFLAIVNASDEDFNALKASINNADGAAESMAETMQDNLKGSITILGSALEGFGIQVYEKMQAPLKNAVDEGTECVNRLAGAFESGGLKGVVAEAGDIFSDLADEIAGTSEVAYETVTPLKDMANEGAKLAKSVLPPAAEAFKTLATNLDIAVPLLVSGAAAMKSYSAAKTASSVIGKLSKSYKASATALDLFITANGVSAVASGAATGAITLEQAAAGALTKQLTVGQAAHAAFNAVVAANPMGLAIAGTIALTGAMIALSAKMKESTKEEKEHTEELNKAKKAAKENLEVAKERRQSFEELVEAQNNQAAADVSQMNNLKSLNDELQTIVDENGKVVAGEENRAAFITSQLSNALGIEISMTDNQISNYQELQGQIQNLIQQKRIDAIMTAEQAKYEEAVANQMQAASEASEAYTAMKQAEIAVESEQAELESLIEEKRQAVIDGNKALVGILDEKIRKQREDVDSAEEALEANKEAYDESTDALRQYSEAIDSYTALAEAAASGNAEAIEEAINRITSGVKTASSATNEELQNQVIAVANTENLIRQEVEKGTPGFTEAMLNQAQSATQAALEEFAKTAPQTAEELSKIPPEAVAALVAGDMKGQLSSEAKGAVDGMLDQFDDLESDTQKAFALAIYGALEGLEGFDQLADPAKEGVEEFLETLRAALDEHSPSKKTEEIFKLAMEGAANGVDSGKEGVLEKAGEFITAFLGKFTEGGLGETLQGIGSNIMSFFGFGVSSQQENSRLAGKANADAANSGANSVNPTGTGSRFGTLLGGGIGSMIGVLLAKGKSLADNAKSGAGSVNPTDTGCKFGTQYASGVGIKASIANIKGKSLADNAKLGANTADGYSIGSNFGSGFVNGIGSWIASAASKAVQLASGAYNAAKKWLDEHSPSKKTVKLGKWFSQGFGGGIDEDAKIAVKAAEEMAENTLDVLDMRSLSERLKDIDIPEVMSRVYMAVGDRQSQVAERVTAPLVAKEKIRIAEESNANKLFEFDYKRLERAMSKRPIYLSAEVNGREVVKMTAEPMNEKIEENNKLRSMLKGVRP